AFVDALAVLGGHAPTDRAAELVGVVPAVAAPAFDLGIAIADGPLARLSHGLVREVAYAALDDARRAALHRAAAALAAARAVRGDHDRACGRGRHFVGGGAVADGAVVGIGGARRAELRAADDEAIAILELVEGAGSAAGLDDRRHAELAIALGRARLRSG